MIKKIFDRASNVNNENLMKFIIRIRVLLKLGLHIKLFKQCSNNRERKRQGTEKNAQNMKMFELQRFK